MTQTNTLTEFKELLVSIALNEIGNGEIGKNNAGYYVEKYLNQHGEPPANWCAAFVSWCIWKAYYESKPFIVELPEYTLSARTLFNNAKLQGKLTETPERGDLIFFWRGSKNSWMGHVGIIESVGPKFLTTIEGNKGKFPSKVKRYLYSSNPENIPNLLGFVSLLPA